MIPKIIHYIWLGGNPFPQMVEKCIKSWYKFCPDWEIKRWDESNLNLDINEYCRQAYDAKKYAFASDALRFEILKRHGGVYLDVDVELLKPLDDLLNCKAFAGLEKYHSLSVAPGLIFGSEKEGSVVGDIVALYNKDSFIKEDGDYNYETVCNKVTGLLTDKYGLKLDNCKQDLEDIIIYPTEYFCPINGLTKENIYQTKNTYSKHLYLASWVPKPKLHIRIKNKIKSIFFKIFGRERVLRWKNKVKRGKQVGK